MGEIIWEAGSRDNGLRYLERAAKAYEDANRADTLPLLYKLLAERYYSLEDHDAVKKNCRKGLEELNKLRNSPAGNSFSNPGQEKELRMRFLKLLNNIYDENDESGTALSYGKELLALINPATEPELSAQVCNNIGFIYLEKKDVAEAEAYFRKAIDAEQYQKGKAILNTLTSTQPANADNFFFLGNLYLTTSPIYVRPDYIDSAKAAFSKGITANAEYALNHVGLGAVELARKGSPKANFDKAISLTKKKDHTTDLYIGRAYVKAPVPMITEGLVHLEKSKLLNDKDAQLYLVLGDAYREQQKNGEAFSAYRNAFELDKTFLRSKVELGKINKLSKLYIHF
jgi:tetratricopeptide (TPR) repeat protein